MCVYAAHHLLSILVVYFSDSGYSGSDASRSSNSPVDNPVDNKDAGILAVCAAKQHEHNLSPQSPCATDPSDEVKFQCANPVSLPDGPVFDSTNLIAAPAYSTMSVTENSAVPIAVLSPLQREGDPTLTSAMALEEGGGAEEKDLYSGLDSLLDEDLNDLQLFEPSQMIICKVESLTNTEEAEFRDILDSDTVTSCLQGLPGLEVDVPSSSATAVAAVCTITTQTHVSACLSSPFSTNSTNALESDFVSEYINAEIITPAEMSTFVVPLQSSLNMSTSEASQEHTSYHCTAVVQDETPSILPLPESTEYVTANRESTAPSNEAQSCEDSRSDPTGTSSEVTPAPQSRKKNAKSRGKRRIVRRKVHRKEVEDCTSTHCQLPSSAKEGVGVDGRKDSDEHQARSLRSTIIKQQCSSHDEGSTGDQNLFLSDDATSVRGLDTAYLPLSERSRRRRVRKPSWKLLEASQTQSDLSDQQSQEGSTCEISQDLLAVKGEGPAKLPASVSSEKSIVHAKAEGSRYPLEIDASSLITDLEAPDEQLFCIPEVSVMVAAGFRPANASKLANHPVTPFVQPSEQQKRPAKGVQGVSSPFLVSSNPMSFERSADGSTGSLLQPPEHNSTDLLTFSLDEVMREVNTSVSLSVDTTAAGARKVQIAESTGCKAADNEGSLPTHGEDRAGRDLAQTQVKRKSLTQLPSRQEERLGECPNLTTHTFPALSPRLVKEARDNNPFCTGLGELAAAEENDEMKVSSGLCDDVDKPLFNLSYVLAATKSTHPLSRSIRYVSESSEPRSSQLGDTSEAQADLGGQPTVSNLPEPAQKETVRKVTIASSPDHMETEPIEECGQLLTSPDPTTLSLFPLADIEEVDRKVTLSPNEQETTAVVSSSIKRTPLRQSAATPSPLIDTSCKTSLPVNTFQESLPQKRGKIALSSSLRSRLGERVLMSPDSRVHECNHEEEEEEDFVQIYPDQDDDCFTMYSISQREKLLHSFVKTPSFSPTPSLESESLLSTPAHPSYKKEQVAKWVEQVSTNPPPPPPSLHSSRPSSRDISHFNSGGPGYLQRKLSMSELERDGAQHGAPVLHGRHGRPLKSDVRMARSGPRNAGNFEQPSFSRYNQHCSDVPHFPPSKCAPPPFLDM